MAFPSVGTDGTGAASFNPWTCLAWLVMGHPSTGVRDEEQTRGDLRPGSLTDAVVLTADLPTVDQTRLGGIEAALTIVGGPVVHEGEVLDAAPS